MNQIHALAILCMLLLSGILHAQSPFADLNQTKAGNSNHYPFYLNQYNNGLLFSGDNKEFGIEYFWMKDTTPELVADLFPGGPGGFSSYGIGPSGETRLEFQGKTYLFGFNPDVGFAMWRMDSIGSVELIKGDLKAGVSAFCSGDSLLYFVTSSIDNYQILKSHQIWQSDGTSAGTVPYFTIPYSDQTIRNIWTTGDQVFYTTRVDSLMGGFVMRTDGTVSGTYELSPLLSMNYFFEGRNIPGFVFKDKFYFMGEALNVAVPKYLLWQSDGTQVGTFSIATLADNFFSFAERPRYLSEVMTDSLFYLRIQSADLTRLDIWKSDGQVQNTSTIFDNSMFFAEVSPSNLLLHNGFLYTVGSGPNPSFNYLLQFDAFNGFKVDEIILDNPENVYSERRLASSGSGKMMLCDFEYPTAEFWLTEGDLSSFDYHFINSDEIPINQPLVGGGDYFYWRSFVNGAGAQIHAIDTAFQISQIRIETQTHSGAFIGGNLGSLAVSDDYFLFFADDGIHGRELWKSDGTLAGTEMLADLRTDGLNSRENPFLTKVNDRFIFNYESETNGMEPHVTDGTSAGTGLLEDLIPGFPGGIGFPRDYVPYGDSVLFFARFNVGGPVQRAQLWYSDGTTAGTDSLYYLPDTAGFIIHNYAAPNGYLVQGLDFITSILDRRFHLSIGNDFVDNYQVLMYSQNISRGHLWMGDQLIADIRRQDSGSELWKSGMIEGTDEMILDIWPGPNGGNPDELTFFKDSLFIFHANDSVHGRELWLSDGTTANTAMIKDVLPGDGSGIRGGDFLSTGYDVFFAALDVQYGTELWRTDGTDSGTYMLKDLNPGPTGSVPFRFFLHDGIVYFSAYTDMYGRELWRSNGTADGTFMVADLALGTQSSNPSGMFVFDSSMYFYADDGLMGQELWKFDPVTTEIEPLRSSVRFNLYPNPTSNLLNIEASEAGIQYEGQVLNLQGQQLMAFENTKVLDIGHLPAGMYIFRIQTADKGTFIQKVEKF